MEQTPNPGTPNLGTLQSGDWQRLQEYADRFEEAWQAAETVDLNQFLPPAGDVLRAVVAAELVKSELEIRCRKGQSVRLEDYLRRFPELASSSGVVARLLYEEYRVRQLFGDRPELTTFRQRFPDHFGDLEKLALAQPVKAPATANAKYLPFGGGYNLLKRIGSGGFGEVWLAEAPGGIKAAVKVLFRPVDHEEARRETQAIDLMKELRHPFLLQPQAYWASEDRIYVVMELADGSLRDRLKECRQEGQSGIPLPELLRYFREAADALDFLHGKHVQHRDIKPENILLIQRHAKVADFGLARAQDSRLVTASGSGTPFYMAPEVWRGKSSTHSDQYALAVTYVELRLDRRPFSSRELAQLMFDHLEATPDLEPLPEAEQVVLRKALAKDAENRYETCGAFVRALELALADQLGRTDPDLVVAASKGGRRDSGVIRGSTQELFGTIRPGLLNETAASVPGAPRDGDDTEKLGESAAGRQARKQMKRVLRMTGVAVLVTACVALGAGLWPWLHSQTAGRAGWLPPGDGWAGKGEKLDEAGGRPLYERLVKNVGNEPVEFVRVRKRPGTDDPATFYLMENKVWVGLFRRFAEARPEEAKSSLWRKLAGQYQNDRFPVLGVSVGEADRFARWLGGRLPSMRQWNWAAGLDDNADPEKGPFRLPWETNEIAVGERTQPVAVGTAAKDVSVFGVRDMAGNGREWTRNLVGYQVEEVPLPKPTARDRVLLRGWSFEERAPLLFKEMRAVPDSGEYLLDEESERASDIGFRVVIEIEP